MQGPQIANVYEVKNENDFEWSWFSHMVSGLYESYKKVLTKLLKMKLYKNPG